MTSRLVSSLVIALEYLNCYPNICETRRVIARHVLAIESLAARNAVLDNTADKISGRVT